MSGEVRGEAREELAEVEEEQRRVRLDPNLEQSKVDGNEHQLRGARGRHLVASRLLHTGGLSDLGHHRTGADDGDGNVLGNFCAHAAEVALQRVLSSE